MKLKNLAIVTIINLFMAVGIFAAPPANDGFANAELVSGMQVHITRSNAEATKEPGEPAHANNFGGASVWFKWTAPMTRMMAFTTNRSSTNLDTVIHIYTGTSVNALTSWAFGSDINAPSNLKSFLRFEAIQGRTYYIAVDGFKVGTTPAPQGTFALDIHPS
ncbi:MAG TPA: hypothetical protein PKE69_21570, partial [Pyrinomonadaceae bacterium]|nr:hypothetical protein [Pyrinomonadaceae bacterium]